MRTIITSRLIGSWKKWFSKPVPTAQNVLTQEAYKRFTTNLWNHQVSRGWKILSVVGLDEIPWSESDERQKRHKELLDKWPRLYGVDRSDTVALHMSDERCLDYLDDVYTEVYLDQLSVKVME